MFKKNSPELKTLAGNIIVLVLITAIIMANNYSRGDIPFMLGIVALGIGLLDIPIAIILFIAGSTDYGKAFLISGGLLLLISGISCGGALMVGWQ